MRNPVLLAAITAELPGVEVALSDDLGCPADDKEAIAFALLGWASLYGLPGNVASCTGARGPRVLGRLTPGRDGWPAVRPLPAWPARLDLTP